MPTKERVDLDFALGLQLDFNGFILGDKLGEGVNREVFVDRERPHRVFKMENHGTQNWTEYSVWCAVKGTPWEKWFAPCLWLSSQGRVLVQARTRMPKNPPPYPEMIPNFMDDVKQGSLGIYKGRWVFHDYGYSHLLKYGLSHAGYMPWPEKNHMLDSPEVKTRWEKP